MASYYAIERTDEYLAHYGIKGMKWGVRRALERGDRAALGWHYQKARAKLARLNNDVQNPSRIARRRVGVGSAISGISSAALTYGLNRIRGADPLTSAKYAGAAGLAGAAGGAIMNAGRATPLERKAAKVRRDQFKREMDRTFKHTSARKVDAERQSLPDRLGPNSPRIGKDNKSGIRYLDLRPNNRRGTGRQIKSASIRDLRINAQSAADRLANAEAARDKSILGRHGFGRTQKAVNEARKEAKDSFNTYYNSMSKKQQARFRKRWVD